MTNIYCNKKPFPKDLHVYKSQVNGSFNFKLNIQEKIFLSLDAEMP